jgi:hypothetical protein
MLDGQKNNLMNSSTKTVLLKSITKPTPIKFSPTQRKWRMMSKIIPLGTGDNTREADRGKLIVIYDGCKQHIGAPDDVVIVPDTYPGKTIEYQKKDLITVLRAQKEILILNGLLVEFDPADIPDDLFNRYCKAVDDINETEDDYVPTKTQVKAVVDLQAEAKEALKKIKR